MGNSTLATYIYIPEDRIPKSVSLSSMGTCTNSQKRDAMCGEVECGNAIIAYSNRFDIRYRNLCYSCCLIVHLYNIVHNHMSIVK